MKLSFFLPAVVLSSVIFLLLFKSSDDYSAKTESNQIRNEVYRKRLATYEMMWLESLENHISLKNRKDIQVLILFSEKKEKGCTMCFKWESEWWYKIIKDHDLDSLVDVGIVLYDCVDLEQTKRILNVCNINLPIIVDSSSHILENLNLEWTPAILIIYENKIMYHYLSDMNNREFSKINMKKFIDFAILFDKKISDSYK